MRRNYRKMEDAKRKKVGVTTRCVLPFAFCIQKTYAGNQSA
jgi:hypothetical protein